MANNRFSTAVRELAKRAPNKDVIGKNFDDAQVLLYADQDFTDADKDDIVRRYRKILDDAQAFNTLGRNDDVARAIAQSTVKPIVVSADPNHPVTPTSTKDPTVLPVATLAFHAAATAMVRSAEEPKPTINPALLSDSLDRMRTTSGPR